MADREHRRGSSRTESAPAPEAELGLTPQTCASVFTGHCEHAVPFLQLVTLLLRHLERAPTTIDA